MFKKYGHGYKAILEPYATYDDSEIIGELESFGKTPEEAFEKLVKEYLHDFTHKYQSQMIDLLGLKKND